jgi:predicted HD superfamily hydrolase involved in NAD metabolism
MIDRELQKYIEPSCFTLLKGLIKEKRYVHSVGVANTALFLAKKFHFNKKKAALAGLLHDCAKDLDAATQRHFIKKYKIKFDTVTARVPVLWHGYIGNYAAREYFDIKDKDILQAIKYHTTGHPEMGDIAKIVFISDFVEINREFESSSRARRLLHKQGITLREILIQVLKEKIDYVISSNMILQPETILLWNKLLA